MPVRALNISAQEYLIPHVVLDVGFIVLAKAQSIHFVASQRADAGLAIVLFSNSRGVSRIVQSGFFLRKKPLSGGGFPP
jgi:hypothetical protein